MSLIIWIYLICKQNAGIVYKQNVDIVYNSYIVYKQNVDIVYNS